MADENSNSFWKSLLGDQYSTEYRDQVYNPNGYMDSLLNTGNTSTAGNTGVAESSGLAVGNQYSNISNASLPYLGSGFETTQSALGSGASNAGFFSQTGDGASQGLMGGIGDHLGKYGGTYLQAALGLMNLGEQRAGRKEYNKIVKDYNKAITKQMDKAEGRKVATESALNAVDWSKITDEDEKDKVGL